ncbi:MAG: AbrB/MazE/SpoVT family DNA-binding domain-containing protein [Caldisphaeraceae archaeon]|nr:AbrB/MazE/SpoVT family DNA-binding domain-containing protein [Caldisphaeraceae archaeon]MEB3692653.1 AbrB/MazE/SpoVT family DNA-binding domain-containing protein [Caldisphaeraceae archaeon]MEB3797719.1 AbrB/MazE/SpoVT family DNA-binding domain-containing protein [Caldisphaeraceae archaeon]
MSLQSTRRIQRLGGSSLIVTLPKQWIKKLGLKVGDELIIEEEGNHLRLSPSEKNVLERADTVRVKYNWVARALGPETLADCALLHGYKKLVISTKGISQDIINDIKKRLDEDNKVESITDLIDSIVVEFMRPEESELQRYIKGLGSKLQTMVDFALKGEPIEDIASEAKDMSTVIIGLSNGNNGLDPLSYGLIATIPSLLYEYLRKVDRERLVVNSQKIKLMISELFGGIASDSARRLLNAIKLSQEIRLSEENNASSGILRSISLLIGSLGSKMMCNQIFNQNEA